MYQVLTIILAIGSICSFIYGLIHKNKALELKDQLNTMSKQNQEWADKISAVDQKVKEDTRDYEKAKNEFNKSNPGSGNPPSGAV